METAAERVWAEKCLGLYRQLHQQPELSGREYRTARVLAGRLRGLGFMVQEHVGETGVVGILRNGPGPSVVLRAELDGLPVEERTGLAYASTAMGTVGGFKHPVSHACGHDVHMASMIAAVEKLVRAKGSWSGTLIVLFQPAEETGLGAQRMLEDGLRDLIGQPSVLLAQHTSALPAGFVTLRSGAVTSAGKNVDVLFHGHGGHAAYARAGTNPAEVAAHAVELLRHRFAESRSMKLAVGSMSAGIGYNTIPQSATVGLGLRADSDERMTRFVSEVRTVVDEIGKLHTGAASHEFKVSGEFPVLENDPHCTNLLQDALERAGSPVYWQAEQAWACEDLGTLAKTLNVPVAYWFLGVSDPALFVGADVETMKSGALPTRIPANHSGNFAPHPTAVLHGAAAMEAAALAFLGRSEG